MNDSEANYVVRLLASYNRKLERHVQGSLVSECFCSCDPDASFTTFSLGSVIHLDSGARLDPI